MSGIYKTITRYVGNFRRRLSVALDWPADGNANHALVRLQWVECRRDAESKKVYIPRGASLAVPPSGIDDLIKELQRFADLIKIGKL